ncbi:hypothetical protein CHS0354_030151 [Potamilus streckersoni]|uniref:Uncharacterized protein n=1 Tax=Potamilus streckersoni TaxID=2493646 RepID=A0AAE0ST14_9BIVA|nr:hypothetical protein CHS0354_030151 [Potamilus streckersoni]
MNNYDPVSLFLLLSATVLHLIGLIMPGWWVVQQTDSVSYFNIWFVMYCTDERNCSETTFMMSGDRAWLIGPAILEVLALATFAACTLLNIYFLLKTKAGKAIRKLYSILLASAGFVIIFGLLIFVKKKAGLARIETETSEGEPGWTMMISIVAAIIAVLDSILTCIGISRNFKKEDEPIIIPENMDTSLILSVIGDNKKL